RKNIRQAYAQSATTRMSSSHSPTPESRSQPPRQTPREPDLHDCIEITEDERAWVTTGSEWNANTTRLRISRVPVGQLRVEPRGLEPLTLCLQSRCATNCATAPGDRSPRS